MKWFSILFLVASVAFADTHRLKVAIEFDDVSTVRSIIERGQAKVDDAIDDGISNDPVPILIIAARAGSENVTQYLVRKGANINIQNALKVTALMMAVYFDDSLYGGDGNFERHDRIARFLVERGANLENGNFYGPLSYAAYRGRTAIGTYLISKGAQVDGPIVNGNQSPINTPAMMASMTGQRSFLRLLLRRNARVDLISHNGQTATQLAKKYNQTHLLPLLQCAESLKPGEKYSDKCP